MPKYGTPQRLLAPLLSSGLRFVPPQDVFDTGEGPPPPSGAKMDYENNAVMEYENSDDMEYE